MKIKAVIVDDIQKAIDTLSKDIKSYCPQIEIIGTATGVIEGAKLINKVLPDLIFLDIQMNDGSGFDLLEIISNKKIKVIFVTAHSDHALKAFRYAAVDYLLKPVDPDDLVQAVEKISQSKLDSSASMAVLEEHFDNKNKVQKTIALNTQEKMHIVQIQDIVRCESEGNYTRFYLNGGKKILVTTTLKEYDELLKQHNFYRVRSSDLVNTNYISEFIKAEDELLLKDGTRINIPDRKRAEVLKMLGEL